MWRKISREKGGNIRYEWNDLLGRQNWRQRDNIYICRAGKDINSDVLKFIQLAL